MVLRRAERGIKDNNAMGDPKSETEALLRLVALGNESALARLFNLHRKRLKRMVAYRIDHQLATQHDPSDVVQEAILVAARRMPEYLQHRDQPFYAWLRQLAWGRLADLHRQYLEMSRRDVIKEDLRPGVLTGKCLSELVRQFTEPLSDGAALGGSAAGRQKRKQVQEALAKLDGGQRELLLLYYVEQLTPPEIAHVMEIEESQVKLRHVRAIRRLRALLDRP